MKVAMFSTKSYDKETFEKVDLKNHEIIYLESSLKERSVRLAEGCDAVCVFVNDRLSGPVIEELANAGIKLIALRCAGFNNVDIEAAQSHGIKVLRVPAYSPHGVAEHAVALILTLNRKTHKAYNRVREGNFLLERLMGFDLYGKTVGVVGTGKIGASFARIMQGFGCRVVAYDKFPNESLEESGVVYHTLEDLLGMSDIISLHCPLNPETKMIINARTLSVMKNGAMLINTSRGKLVDTEAVIGALKTGHLGYLGIDVYEQEEKLFFKDLSEMVIVDDKISRLMTFPNVLITAHQAYLTDHALSQIAETTVQNLTDFESGTVTPSNEVTLSMVQP